MALFQKKRKIQETIETFQQDLEAVKADLDGFKKNVESDLGSIKQDFRELILFLQENPESEENSEEEDDADDGRDGEEPASLEGIQGHLSDLSERVTDLVQWSGEQRRELAALKSLINEEMKSVRGHVADARKEINSKITYAVSRLRS
jgi:chromosome segregation ATPase